MTHQERWDLMVRFGFRIDRQFGWFNVVDATDERVIARRASRSSARRFVDKILRDMARDDARVLL